MGGVLSMIGNCLTGIVNVIGSIIKAIVNGIVAFFDILISCITCGKGGGGRRSRGTTSAV